MDRQQKHFFERSLGHLRRSLPRPRLAWWPVAAARRRRRLRPFFCGCHRGWIAWERAADGSEYDAEKRQLREPKLLKTVTSGSAMKVSEHSLEAMAGGCSIAGGRRSLPKRCKPRSMPSVGDTRWQRPSRVVMGIPSKLARFRAKGLERNRATLESGAWVVRKQNCARRRAGRQHPGLRHPCAAKWHSARNKRE